MIPTHYYRIKKFLPQRFGEPCRLLVSGPMNSVLIEFEDGTKVRTSRYFLRKIYTLRTRSGDQQALF